MGTCAAPCPASGPSGPRRPPRAPLLKWLLSLLVCCWADNRNRSLSGDNDNDSEDGVELGPLTLSQYIATLQPYDPEVHGWRGDEPRRLRPRRPTPPPPADGAATATRSPLHTYAYSSVSYQPRKRSSVHAQNNRII